MSLSSTTNRVRYTAAGTTATYSYTFKVFSSSDLLVTVQHPTTGAETALTLSTDYTVTGVGESSGGTIVLVDSGQAWINGSSYLTVDWIITISRVMTLSQPLDVRNQGSFYPADYEDALDKKTMQIQQVEKKANTSLRLKETDDHTIDTTIPHAEDRAQKFLTFDATGAPDVSDGVAAASDVVLPGTNGMAAYTGSSTFVGRTITAGSVIEITDGDGQSGNPTVAVNVSGATEDTAPTVADMLLSYDDSAAGHKKVSLATLLQLAATPNFVSNLGIAAATTTTTNDSVKVQGASAALSATNPLYVTMTSTTAGQLAKLSATADVTIKLTGAHWGAGTLGDLTGARLYVYAIYNGTNITWGVSTRPDYKTVNGTNCSATQTDVTAATKILVNSMTNISGGTVYPCLRVASFTADFDDTGGAAEDLWALQTSADDFRIGNDCVPGHAAVVLNTGNGHGSSSTKIRRFVNVERNEGSGISVAQSSTLGDVLTVLEAGFYNMTYWDYRTAGGCYLGVSRNTSAPTTSVSSITTAQLLCLVWTPGAAAVGIVTVSTWLEMGDRIRPHTDGNPDSIVDNFAKFSIAKAVL